MAVSAPSLVPPAAPSLSARIADLARHVSFETTRPSDAELAALAEAAAPGTRIYVSAIPSHPTTEQIAIATRLRRLGFEPVPHVAARNFTTTVELDAYLGRMVDEAGVRRILVIGGDRDQPAGYFHHAVEVIDSGLPQSRGILDIGIAGYPEGHPRVAEIELERALANKIEAASQTGASIHIVTQFAFAADPIVAWISRLRERGIELPIRIGLAGPASVARLIRFAAICGVAASSRALSRNAGLAKHLFGTSVPDAPIRGIAQTGDHLGQIAPHIFSFGGLGASARWAAAVAAGRFTLDRADGFSVEPP